jgi:hypothetical protein
VGAAGLLLPPPSPTWTSTLSRCQLAASPADSVGTFGKWGDTIGPLAGKLADKWDLWSALARLLHEIIAVGSPLYRQDL